MNSQRENLINSLIEDGYLKTPEIIEAFRAIDRADFIPDEFKEEAYINAPLPIGFGQTISQPLVVAFMLELLEPKSGQKIMDIGAGSGWTTALLAYLLSKPATDYGPQQEASESGGNPSAVFGSPRVIAIERIPELKEFAERNMNKHKFIEKGIARVLKSDGSKGYKKESPYDKILGSAAAEGDVPKAWKEQLKIGGRIVSPVGANIRVIDKISKNEYNTKDFFGFSFVPLVKD